MFEYIKYPSEKTHHYPDPRAESVEREYIEQKESRKFEKKIKFRERLAFKLGALALAVTTVASAYWGNVEDNRAEQNAAEISINYIAPAINGTNINSGANATERTHSNEVTFVDDGFNANDADYLADDMTEAIQQVAMGDIVSVGYNNALLSRENIYTSMIEYAKKNGYTSISIVGYSMGGIIGIESATDIIKNSDIPVQYLILISTPDGSEGVRPYQKNEIDFMQWLTNNVPGAVDSSWFRIAGDVYFYRDSYTKADTSNLTDIPDTASNVLNNAANFMQAVQDALDNSNNPRSTKMKTISQQTFKVTDFNMESELNDMASQKSTKQMPIIVYFGTGYPGYDTVVDDKVTAENFAIDAKNAGLFYKNMLVPGAVHSHYYDTPEAYIQTFYEAKEPMAQALKAEMGRHALSTFAQNILKNMNTNILAEK